MKYGIALIVSFMGLTAFSQSNKKLLIIGIDGCRADVITHQFAPTLDSIIHLPNTAYTYKMKNEFHTISAPNWTSMLTGVHCFRHRALRNNFAHRKIEKYPHFFKYLKENNSKLKTYSLSEWDKINPCIVNGNADVAPLYDMSQSDATNRILNYLNSSDSVPDAAFIHYDEVDHNGHKSGFSKKNPDYTNALSKIDADINKIFAAVQERKTKYGEDWLVIVSTDHGGRKHGHVGGHGAGTFNRHIRRVFLIINGDDAKPGKIKKAHTVDVACTALQYFGVPIKREWRLQGKAVGIK